MTDKPLLSQFNNHWRAYCPDCKWNSGDLPFPNPDEALHCLALHKAVSHDIPFV